MANIRTILVATDFSEPADAAWSYALGLARQLKCRLHLLHVVTVPYVYDAWTTETVALRMPELLDESEKVARRQLRSRLPKSGLIARRIVTATAKGIITDQILEYIAAKRMDLVVLGTHGRGTVGHLFVGSVAERLVRRSSVPVLTVRGQSPSPPRGKRRR